jgi:hypothetical protein
MRMEQSGNLKVRSNEKEGCGMADVTKLREMQEEPGALKQR